MNINVESHFAQNPTSVNISRSRFDRSSQHKTTFNAGQLIPIFVDEVLPGDTFEMDTSMLIRMSTPVFPVLDNAYFDYYYFFVPNRLLWDHWEEFCGENKETYWTQTTEYTVPTLQCNALNDDCPNKGSVADYFGIPTNVSLYSVNALPFRAYVKIWNDWFRDENVQEPAYFVTDDSDRSFSPFVPEDDIKNGAIVNYNTAIFGGCPLPVAKYHDYFTSCLPAPQKGEPVVLSPTSGIIPVNTGKPDMNLGILDENGYGLSYAFADGSSIPLLDNQYLTFANFPGSVLDPGISSGYLGENMGKVNTTTFSPEGYENVIPSNLYVDLQSATAITVNEMRQAFQIQKLLEKDARGGTRYIELIQEHFGVTSPDARLQRSEYLGGARIPINIDQVVQTSSTDAVSPQGNTAAYSLTRDSRSSFTQSFTEHGFIICVGAVRTEHSYQQGLERFWSRNRRFDYYYPVLANIGEQAVLKKELCAGYTFDEAQPAYQQDNQAFGYQEAWADYRYKPSRVSGAFRSNYATSLDVWHYADEFTAPNYDTPNLDSPVLNSDFITETMSNIDRTLAVTSSVEDQFIADFYFKTLCVRPMPMYSIPGLIDHN